MSQEKINTLCRTMLGVVGHLTETLDYSELPAQYLMILFKVAYSRSPVPMGDLMETTGTSLGSISRSCEKLGVTGYGLVEAYEDPEYRRRKLVRLTPKGHALIETLTKKLPSTNHKEDR